MDSKKRKRLEAAGWTFGNAEDFLGMSPEEASYLEVKLTLAREVEAQRKKAGLSQSDLAAKLKTRQPNIARLEKAQQGVTIDALFKTLLALGLTPRKIAASL
jgi:ribosome-binding protein aMBF1 (putative translation factor)